MRYVLIAAMLLVASIEARVQQVRRDPATGNYYVIVYNDDREPQEIQVEVADRVEYTIAATLMPVGKVLRYIYEVRVDDQSPQGLRAVQVDCPQEAALIRAFSAATTYQGRPRNLNVWQGLWADLPTCEAMLGVAPIVVGERLSMTFESPFLPALGEARGLGYVHGISWPTSDPIAENEAAVEFVASVQGDTGGWKEITSVVPTRDPALFADPLEGLALIRGDVVETCSPTLGWITSGPVCDSLAAELDRASSAIGRAGWKEARATRCRTRPPPSQAGPTPRPRASRSC